MNIYRKSQKGFTLIELLVVIAIIGILSSVVLASLSNARIKSNDVSVKANLTTIRSEIELYYLDNGGSYGDPEEAHIDVCDQTGQPFVSGNIAKAISSAENSGNSIAVCAIGQDGDTWSVSVPMLGGGSWCVASVGTGGEGTASGGGGVDATCSS